MLNIQKKRLLSLVSLPIFLGLSCSLQGTQEPRGRYENMQERFRKYAISPEPINLNFTLLKIACSLAALKYAQKNPDSSSVNRALALLPTAIFYASTAKQVFTTTS